MRIDTVLLTFKILGGFVTGIGQPAQLVWTLYVWDAPLKEFEVSYYSSFFWVGGGSLAVRLEPQQHRAEPYTSPEPAISKL
jgi:hypothetical protein